MIKKTNSAATFTKITNDGGQGARWAVMKDGQHVATLYSFIGCWFVATPECSDDYRKALVSFSAKGYGHQKAKRWAIKNL